MEMGTSWLDVMANQVEHNELLHRLYPEVKPDYTRWSKDRRRLSVRSDKREGGTWTVRTFNQSITGRHVSAMVWDDPVTDRNYRDMGKQDAIKERLSAVWPTISKQEDGADWLIFNGTPYTDYDLWSHILEEFYPEGIFDVFVQPVRGTAYVNEVGQIIGHDDGRYAHPEEWNDERFEKTKRNMKKTPDLFMSQYLLDTSYRGADQFNPEWIQYVSWAEIKDLPLTLYIAGDGASGTGTSNAALSAVGISSNRAIYIMRVQADFTSERSFIATLFDWIKELRPAQVGIERYSHGGHTLYQNIEQTMYEQAGKDNMPFFALAPLTNRSASPSTGPGSQRKVRRIRETLFLPYQNGRIYHTPIIRSSTYERGLRSFPGLYLDEVDATSYAVSMALNFGFQESAMYGDYGHLAGVSIATTTRRGMTAAQLMAYDGDEEGYLDSGPIQDERQVLAR